MSSTSWRRLRRAWNLRSQERLRRKPPGRGGRRRDRKSTMAGRSKADGLRTYERKRNFRSTPEPPARPSRASEPRVSHKPGPKDAPLSFVVQKHRATRLHYDFRLELDG